MSLTVSIVAIIAIISSFGFGARVQSNPLPSFTVDIYTNKGGQGPNQYGGSFTIGESILLYVYSSIDGTATLQITLPDGEVETSEPFQVVGGQTISIPGSVGPPPGVHRIDLQVCRANPPTETTNTTPFASPPPQDSQNPSAGRSPGLGPSDILPPCAQDSTWIDVVGGPADIYVSHCWVNPTNPLQEDQVTFYATVGNSGGTDAPNVKIDSYLDGSLFSTERNSLPAGSSGTWQSDRKWTAEDGSHTLRVVANADHSVQESDYSNNEASCTFFVRPHTVTATVTTTKTSTRTQTQHTETTITVTHTTTKLYTTDTTILQTKNANPVTVTQTLSGLSTYTVYSPTVTITVQGSVQAGSNLFLWLAFSSLMMVGAVLQSPYSERLRRLCRKIVVLLPFPELLSWLAKRHVRKTLFALCLISVAILSLTSQAGQLAFGSTVTSTRTTTSTEWTTISTTLTSTRYSTSTVTDTSTFTRTSTSFTTVTPTLTTTINERSTTTIYLPTTTWTTQHPTSVSGGIIILGVRAFCDSSKCVDRQPTKGLPFSFEVQMKNTDSVTHEVSLTLDASLPVKGRGDWQLNSRTKLSPTHYSHTFQPGESATATFSITGWWNWINPEITNALEIASLLASGMNPGALGVLVADYVSLMAQLAEIGTAAPKLVLTIVPSGSSDVPLGTQHAEVQVRRFNILMLAVSIALAGFSLGLDAHAVATLVTALIASAATAEPVPLLVPAAEFLLGALCYALSLAAYQLARGDPDNDYRAIVTPQNITVPELETIDDADVKRLGTETLGLFSYFNASLVSLARFFSAEEAGDTAYMVKQLDAAANFMETSRQKAKIVGQIEEEKLSGSMPDENAVERAKVWLADNGMPLFSKGALDKIAGTGSSDAFVRSLSTVPNALIASSAKYMPKSLDDPLRSFIDESRRESEEIRSHETGNLRIDWLPYSYVLLPVAVAIVGIYIFMTRRRAGLIRPPGGFFCRRCGVKNRLGSGFCRHCGAPLSRVGIPCRSCRTPNRPTASFCRRCGSRLH